MNTVLIAVESYQKGECELSRSREIILYTYRTEEERRELAFKRGYNRGFLAGFVACIGGFSVLIITLVVIL